jgi:hypothetical protein
MSQLFNISKTANVDFYIKRGDLFYFNFAVRENENFIDLSSYTHAVMQVKENEYSSSVLTLSSSGSTIDIQNLVAGQIIINSPTTNLVSGVYYYDLELRDNTYLTETVMSGKIFVDCDYSN